MRIEFDVILSGSMVVLFSSRNLAYAGSLVLRAIKVWSESNIGM